MYYILFRIYMVIMRFIVLCVPAFLCYRWCSCLTVVILPFLRKRVAIMHKNLALVYPQMTTKEREKRIQENIADFLMMPYFQALSFYGSSRHFNKIKRKGFEQVEEWLNTGERVILVWPHWHSLECVGRIGGEVTGSFASVKRNLKNPLIDAYVTRVREYYCEDISHKDMRSIYRHLKQPGSMLGILPDQYMKGVQTHFLGVRTQRTDSVARLANRFNAKVVVVDIKMDVCQQSMALVPLALTGDIAQDHQALFDLMSHLILNNPKHYLWFHNMFKCSELSKTMLENNL
ncbi:MAG: lysophospholipid acyltransferase family protein [Candidatus Comchoanobacterales bacterium]